MIGLKVNLNSKHLFIPFFIEFGIDLSNNVVFIDEMVVSNQDQIGLLRNLCRTVHLPVVLSGTNAKVQNLIGKTGIPDSRVDGINPWVKVVTRFPRATLKSFGSWITFEPLNNLSGLASLYSFINRLGEIDYERLLSALINRQDFAVAGDWEFLKKLLRFTIDQTCTSLPGLGIIALNDIICEEYLY